MKYTTMPKCYKEESKPQLFCPGCGHAIILKQLGSVIDELSMQNKTVFCIDIGCSLLAWNFFDFDTIQAHHGRSIPVAIGVKKVAASKNVIAYMGDGGAYAIGLQSLIHAAYRNDPVLAIVVNNNNYAMTGGQMAPTTIIGEITTTSPHGKKAIGFGDHLLGPEIISTVANKNALVARVSVSNPRKIKSTLKKAIDTTQNGNFAMIEILSICPTNWKTNAVESFEFLEKLEDQFPVQNFLPQEAEAK